MKNGPQTRRKKKERAGYEQPVHFIHLDAIFAIHGRTAGAAINVLSSILEKYFSATETRFDVVDQPYIPPSILNRTRRKTP